MGCFRGLISILAIVFVVAVIGSIFGNRPTAPNGIAAVETTGGQPAPATQAKRPYSELIAEAAATLDGYDFTTGVKTVDDVAASLVMLDEFAKIAAEVPDAEADKAARLAFTKSLRTIQRQVLPKLRDKYGPAMRQEMWEADGSAKTIGQGYRTVEFVAAAFAANRNIKSAYETLYPSLMRLRFTRAQFKWFDGASEFQYYSMSPPSDDDVVTWSGGAFTQVWPLPAQ